MVEIHHFSPFRLFTAATWTVTIVNSCNRHTKDIAQPKWHTFLTFPTIHSCNMDSDHRELIGTQRILHNQNDTHCHKRPAQGCSNLKIAYRIISNISTVLYFFNVPPPRAINGDVPLLETVPLLFQSHFRGMLPCQIHVWHTHFRFFSPVQIMNLHSVLIMETEHFIFWMPPQGVLLLETCYYWRLCLYQR